MDLAFEVVVLAGGSVVEIDPLRTEVFDVRLPRMHSEHAGGVHSSLGEPVALDAPTNAGSSTWQA